MRVYYRHRVVTRVCHWINVLCLGFLLTSGLNIFNAHPALYWGQYGANADVGRQWLAIGAADVGDGMLRGMIRIGSLTVDTTGVLGVSRDAAGRAQAIGFPRWITFPSIRDLATARRWHFFFGWIFILNGLVYLLHGFAIRHLQDAIWPKLRELSPANVWHDIVAHARLRFPRGDDDRRYHVLQKVAYAGTIFLVLPLLVITGLAMSPGINAAVGGILPQLFGGRASARSIHFIITNLTILFVLVHVAMVILAGPFNQLRSMITGWYDVGRERR